RYQPLYEFIEGRAGSDILEGLPAYRLAEPGSVGDDLGDLPACSVVVGPEVRQVIGWHARLAWAPTSIAAYVATRRQPSNEVEEGGAGSYILEHLDRLRVGEAR